VSYTGVADLGLTKAATPDPVSAGDNLTYTLTVHNAGPSTAHAVALRDTVPAGVSPVSVASPPGTTCVGGTPGNPADPLACALGNLGPGATAVVTVVVRVAPNLAAGTVLVNQASVVSDSADPNNANNIAGRSVTVQTRADLAITKTSDEPPQVHRANPGGPASGRRAD
jgi:uncharacterized repeat protein (TIGR01451 family)